MKIVFWALAMVAGLSVWAQKPEWERKPIEIIKGHLPKPHYPVLWNAQDNGIGNWQIEGDCKAELSTDFCLWNEQSIKLTFKTTPGRVVLKPARIVLPDKANAIEMWVYGFKSGKPANHFEVQDAIGKTFTLKTRGNTSYWAKSPWWGASIGRIPKEAVAPITLTKVVFDASDKIEAGDAMYFDFICAVTVENAHLPDTSKWDMSFPYKKESIQPTPIDKKITMGFTSDKKGRISFTFNGSGGNLVYVVEPKTGTLNDLSVTVNGSHTFKPMANGGVKAEVNGVRFLPTDTDVKATLLNSIFDGATLKTAWRLEKQGVSVEYKLQFGVMWRSLIISCTSEKGDFSAFDCGHTQGTPNPRLFKLTYLNYRWNYPRLLVTDDYFVSIFPDWYTSHASEVVDGSNHSWLEGAKVMGEDSARIMGGSIYIPKAGSTLNPLHERFFLTIAPDLESVLPNIPNPRSEYYEETGQLLYCTRMYDSQAPGDSDLEVEFWRLMADYGMREVFVRYHMNMWRTPFRNNHFTHYDNPHEPVGTAGYQQIARELKKVIRRVGPYEDNRVSHPLGPEFTYNDMAIYSDGTYREGWDASFQPSPAAQHRLEAEFAPKLVAKFGWNGCYFDEVTNTPPWGLVDYNPDIPGSATYLNVLRNYAFVARKLSDYYDGPIWSEGNAAFFWAGYLDTDYAQTNDPDSLPIVDFKLRKVNPLEHLNGYDLTRAKSPLDYLLSAQIVHGNMGHLWTGESFRVYHGSKLIKNLKTDDYRHLFRSYFMMLQLQELYAETKPSEITYSCGGEMLTATQMLRQNKPNEGKVYTRYANGLEVWVNRNPQEKWTVEVDGKSFVLPPYGYAAFMPGKLVEYSAEIDGHRVDYSRGPRYLYVDGRGIETQFPEITAANAYVLFKEGDATILIPLPFIAEEAVSGLSATCIQPLDRAGKPLAPETDLDVVDGGNARFTVTKEPFKYKLK
ncbi:MAG: hypothetical protein IKP00_11590 [Victivallales bacterium]|nr:hypothetical protein [Victivallales bacterium]